MISIETNTRQNGHLPTGRSAFQVPIENAPGDADFAALRRDLAGEARGFFRSGTPVHVARAPGRLDVMGGVADYSGSVVLESPIAAAALVAIQRRPDRQIRVWTIGPEAFTLASPRLTIQLDDLYRDSSRQSLHPASAVRQLLASTDSRWAGYVVGALYVLLDEFQDDPDQPLASPDSGFDILLRSDVPIAAGVASSAAVEVAAMSALEHALGLRIDDLRFARLCQMIEHAVVGAPCGIMDQVTCALGKAGSLLALRCQPHEHLGDEPVPVGCHFVGIDSGVKHSIGASRYVRSRVGAFMGLKIVTNHLRAIAPLASGSRASRAADLDTGEIPWSDPTGGYLCNITPEQFRTTYSRLIPGRVRGTDFLREHGEIDDAATNVDPDTTYSPRGCAEHAIYENQRVQRFASLLGQARDGDQHALVEAGKLMYGSHWSYTYRCGLGSPETSRLVAIARSLGNRGVLGAKITGGGSGGTVAVMLAPSVGQLGVNPESAHGALEDPISEISRRYFEETGIRPRIVDGTSPGARQWGVRALAV